MDYKDIAERLHELERKVLLALKVKKVQVLDELAVSSGLNRDAVQRALLWLSSKGLVSVKDDVVEEAGLTPLGRKYLEDGLPEVRFLKLIQEKPLSVQELSGSLSKDELNVSLGFLRRQGCISFVNSVASITAVGREFLNRDSVESLLLRRLEKGVDVSLLSENEKQALNVLKGRSIAEVSLRTGKTVSLIGDGERILKYVKLEKLVEQLTPEMIRSCSWESTVFRAYDVTAPVPRTFPGKKHFLYEVMEMIKSIFTEMGFMEMRSNYVESCFWNYDVMFFPQDHPDRGIMDTFYLFNDLKASIPVDYAGIIKKVQETGWTTGSKGRGGIWDINEARKLMLRCHTTQTTFRYLAKKLRLPYKFFSVDRVFRNETVDYKHLPEFHQVEGFVVDEGLTFRHLLGYLKEFYNKMGVKKLRLKPTYNPYTEPSTEIFGWFPKLRKWIELGNSGVFRPEVLLPVGVKSPVVAWGLALERLAMFVYDIDDIRQCLGHTVDFNSIRSRELLTRIKK